MYLHTYLLYMSILNYKANDTDTHMYIYWCFRVPSICTTQPLGGAKLHHGSAHVAPDGGCLVVNILHFTDFTLIQSDLYAGFLGLKKVRFSKDLKILF